MQFFRRTPRAIGLLLTLIALIGCGAAASGQAGQSGAGKAFVVHVGYQKGGSLPLLKGRGDLEKRLEPLGGTVEWTEFPAGPPLLEALNSGTVDIGSTGQTPPIFAQAAGTPLVYVATQAPSNNGQSLIVPENSPIKTIADLKGKKVAFAKGSSANYFIIGVLAEAGLAYTDIEPVYLTPPDARPAFDGGSVDAWVIWEPYLTIALKATNARVIHDGTTLTPSRGYYLAAKQLVDGHPDALKIILEEVDKVERWSAENPDQVAEILAPVIGVDVAILKDVYRRQSYGLLPLTDAIITEQQAIADTFSTLGLIPKPIVIRDATWIWQK